MFSEAGALFRMGSFYRCKNRTHFFCYVLEVCAELCDFQGGHRWITQATLLKTAHWAVFALSSATAPQLFESTRSMSLALLQNKNLSVLVYVEAFWWAQVDVASRASKKAPQGLFCPPDYSAGRCCSNPPAFVSLAHKQNKKL